jgi:amino acid adenylation domain-containing protein
MAAHDDLMIEIYYAVALFDPATIQRMLTSLRVLMAGVAAGPSRRISELPIMTEEDLRRELVEWNSNDADFPPACLHELFEAHARATPEAIAAVFGETRMSYAELNSRANLAARHLRGLGASPDSLVGVHMAPSLERLATILGILKAGGAYVPLDPEYPEDRLRFMLEDADVTVVAADPAGEARMSALGAKVIIPARDWPEGAGEPAGNLEPVAGPHNAAYVIYTSGSTGKPKGVVVEHAQVVNFVQGMVAHWPLRGNDQFLQFASLNFDVSLMDMFLALGSGGTAVFGSRETLLSPPRLAELIRAHEVTFAVLPPAVLSLLTGEPFPSLRVLISAGEELSPELVRGWLRPGLRMCNGYGPTEVTIGATIMELSPDDITPPPIGMPKPNYRAYVLDSHGNPVPVGVAGELHLGGSGVARGYLNRPELTQEKFIPDPFSPVQGTRMYKTGDLVRRRPDGNIVFLGRIDGQVKIRGLRVELGEIETAMTVHPAVAQAVVIVTDDAAGEKQLIGYARQDPAQPPLSVSDLRQYLSQRLPGYMVPAHLMLLAEFPLNASGKIDRKALPEPSAEQAGAGFVAPRTLVETMLVDAYGTLLKLDQVSVEDSFFDLGGNSLLAMRLITRLRDDLAVDADVTAVFLAPTPSQLAVLLGDKYGLEDMELGADGLDGLADLAGAGHAV